MAEEVKVAEVVEEIKNATEEDLKETIEKWFESTRTSGMKIGAQYISAGIFGIIQKHIKKKAKPSLRDYQRCMDEIIQVISVQLIKQNDSEEVSNDGTTEDTN
jgi:O-acetyl-ADP-ribose deacetylase (regulator of RNase III)